MCWVDFNGLQILLYGGFELLDLWLDDLDFLILDLFLFFIQAFDVSLNVIGSNFERIYVEGFKSVF